MDEIESALNKFDRKKDASIDISRLNGKITITEIEYDTNSGGDTNPQKRKTTTEINFTKEDSLKADVTIINRVNDETRINKDSTEVVNNESESGPDKSVWLKYIFRIILGISVLILAIFVAKKKISFSSS